MGALPQSSARPFNRKLGFVYAKYFANHRHNAALPRSYFLDQLCQADRRENPKPVASFPLPPSRRQASDVRTRLTGVIQAAGATGGFPPQHPKRSSDKASRTAEHENGIVVYVLAGHRLANVPFHIRIHHRLILRACADWK